MLPLFQYQSCLFASIDDTAGVVGLSQALPASFSSLRFCEMSQLYTRAVATSIVCGEEEKLAIGMSSTKKEKRKTKVPRAAYAAEGVSIQGINVPSLVHAGNRGLLRSCSDSVGRR
jgi:hypothetical protein